MAHIKIQIKIWNSTRILSNKKKKNNNFFYFSLQFTLNLFYYLGCSVLNNSVALEKKSESNIRGSLILINRWIPDADGDGDDGCNEDQ